MSSHTFLRDVMYLTGLSTRATNVIEVLIGSNIVAHPIRLTAEMLNNAPGCGRVTTKEIIDWQKCLFMRGMR